MNYTLRNWISDFSETFDMTVFSDKVLNMEIKGQRVVENHGNPFDDKYKNLFTWVILSDDSVVGMNESPTRGISFVRKKKWKQVIS